MGIRDTITSSLGRQVLLAQKHSPVLLFATGIVGVGASIVLSCKATLKLGDVLEEGKSKLEALELPQDHDGESAYKKKQTRIKLQTAIEVAKLYALPAAITIGTIGAITGSHVVLSRRNVGLSAAYAALDKGFKEYRSRVVEALGVDQDLKFRYDLEEVEGVEETEDGPVPITILKPKKGSEPSIYAVFFDEFNSKYWKKPQHMNQFFLKSQEIYANQLLNGRGHLFLSEVLDMLGIDRTPESTQVGWIRDTSRGDCYVDFGIFRDSYVGQSFINGDTNSILLDFNVDGEIWRLI